MFCPGKCVLANILCLDFFLADVSCLLSWPRSCMFCPGESFVLALVADIMSVLSQQMSHMICPDKCCMVDILCVLSWQMAHIFCSVLVSWSSGSKDIQRVNVSWNVFLLVLKTDLFWKTIVTKQTSIFAHQTVCL